MPCSVRSKARQQWRRFSAGDKAVSILKKESLARSKRSTGRGHTCLSITCKNSTKHSSWSVFKIVPMRDKSLETKLRLVTLQLENWKKLHDLITYGLDKAKPIISTEQERQFTEIRANLLQEIEYVLRELNMLAEVSGKAMSVLQRGVSVRGVRDLSNDEVRRLETDWNGVFTKFGLMQGQLKARRKELAEQTAFNYYMNRLLRRPATAH